MGANDERLFEAVSPVATGCGLELGSASFYRRKELQASWRMNGGKVDLMVSDYLEDAPDGVIGDFSRAVLLTVVNRRPVYGGEYLDWVRSDRFISSKRGIYVKRSRNLTRSPEGAERDIIGSLDRLLDSGLLDPGSIDNSFFSWTRAPNVARVGFCSPMMRVVGVSSALDAAPVPEFVLDYVVYHESLHLAQGYRPGRRPHDKAFRDAEGKYPRRDEAVAYLRSMRARLE
ncbi:MAG: hypothetical protein FWH47_07195 [Methanomassiliicoccaceae archaeon]|nr:hypothetical protein [Methanomassiliicoccaceae archaeon]